MIRRWRAWQRHRSVSLTLHVPGCFCSTPSLCFIFFGRRRVFVTLTSGRSKLQSRTENVEIFMNHCPSDIFGKEKAALWQTSWPREPPGPYKLDHNSPGPICWGHCPPHKHPFISPSSAHMPVVAFSRRSRWPRPAAGRKVHNKKHLNVADLKPAAGVGDSERL